MRQAMALICFCIATWGVGYLVPGLDPYLVLALALAGSGVTYPAGMLAVAISGWWGASLGMTSVGWMVGPLMLTFALFRWARDHFVLRGFGMLLLWSVGASAMYHGLMIWCRHGLAYGLVSLMAHTVWHAAWGLLAMHLLNGWLRWVQQPWRRKRLAM